MKKNYLLFVLSILFAGCSSDGSREIQIDEVKFIPEYDNLIHAEYKNVSSILEVVPGKYELAWNLTDDDPQLQNYNISLKLNLRLKRTVKVKQEVMDEVTNCEGKNHAFISPFKFCLVDANGKKENITVQAFDLSYAPVGEWASSGSFNKDQTMDFLRFLQSKPGSEIELVMNAIGSKTKDNDCIEICKGAKGIVCTVGDDDELEYRVGTIE